MVDQILTLPRLNRCTLGLIDDSDANYTAADRDGLFKLISNPRVTDLKLSGNVTNGVIYFPITVVHTLMLAPAHLRRLVNTLRFSHHFESDSCMFEMISSAGMTQLEHLSIDLIYEESDSKENTQLKNLFRTIPSLQHLHFLRIQTNMMMHVVNHLVPIPTLS